MKVLFNFGFHCQYKNKLSRHIFITVHDHGEGYNFTNKFICLEESCPTHQLTKITICLQFFSSSSSNKLIYLSNKLTNLANKLICLFYQYFILEHISKLIKVKYLT